MADVMKPQRIESLSISGFRAFNPVDIKPFGRVNLITGQNNAGKSSLLEAIRLLVTGATNRTILDILEYREESDRGRSYRDRPDQILSPDSFAPICSLFTGFPTLTSCSEGFVIASRGTDEPLRSVTAKIAWYHEEFDETNDAIGGGRRLVRVDGGSEDSQPALEVSTGAGRNRLTLLSRLFGQRSSFQEPLIGSTPCIYLDPFSSRSTSQLANLWDAIALTPLEKEVVSALRIISPEIEAVSVIGSSDGSPRYNRTAIARSSKYQTPVPLRSFGDGLNRLFGIVLSLCSARSGILLVDEIENGLHHLVLRDMWRAIFRLASDLDVQVFASSHSWDCIEAFQIAATESTDEGTLVRLTSRNGEIFPTVFGEIELKVATKQQIELR